MDALLDYGLVVVFFLGLFAVIFSLVRWPEREK